MPKEQCDRCPQGVDCPLAGSNWRLKSVDPAPNKGVVDFWFGLHDRHGRYAKQVGFLRIETEVLLEKFRDNFKAAEDCGNSLDVHDLGFVEREEEE